MSTLSKTDMIHITRRIPKHIRKIMQETPGIVIGGGFIRELIAGGKVSDLDLFDTRIQEIAEGKS